MASRYVSFSLQAPGERAGQVLAELERQLGSKVGLSADSMVTVRVEAGSQEEATEQVLGAIASINAGGYFDLHGLHQSMAVSVRRYRLGAGSLNELTARVDEGFAHILSEVPGFVAFHLVHAGENVLVSIRVFASPDGLARSDELTADWVRQNLAEFRLEPLEEDEGEVLVSRRSR